MYYVLNSSLDTQMSTEPKQRITECGDTVLRDDLGELVAGRAG